MNTTKRTFLLLVLTALMCVLYSFMSDIENEYVKISARYNEYLEDNPPDLEFTSKNMTVGQLNISKNVSITEMHGQWLAVMSDPRTRPLPCEPAWHRRDHGIVSTLCPLDTPLREASIIIFTSFKDLPHRAQIHRNTIENWALYRPVVQPVLFQDGTDPELVQAAREHGWVILPGGRGRQPERREARGRGSQPGGAGREGHGGSGPGSAPRLKDMYTRVARLFPRAAFIGWSNGDILFTEGLIKTIHLLLHQCDEESQGSVGSTGRPDTRTPGSTGTRGPPGSSQNQDRRIFLTGARYNVFNTNSRRIVDPAHVYSLITAYSRDYRFTKVAQDYFFIHRNLFPWDRIPDGIVIGWPGYDNYLVSMAIESGMEVVDGSCSVGALHQMGKEGTRAGFMNADSDFNRRLIRRSGGDWHLGGLHCTPYFTKLDREGKITLMKHTEKVKKCL